MFSVKNILLTNIKYVKILCVIALIFIFSVVIYNLYLFIKNKKTEKYTDSAYMIFLDKPKYKPTDSNYNTWITMNPPPAQNSTNANTTYYQFGKKINNIGDRLATSYRTNISDINCANEQQTNEIYTYIYQKLVNVSGVTKTVVNGKEYLISNSSSPLKNIFDEVKTNLSTCQSHICTNTPTTSTASTASVSVPSTTGGITKESLQTQITNVKTQADNLQVQLNSLPN